MCVGGSGLCVGGLSVRRCMCMECEGSVCVSGGVVYE